MARVVREQPPPPSGPLPGAPPLPAWARQKLDQGCRLSVQWRLTNRAHMEKALARDEEMWNRPIAQPSVQRASTETKASAPSASASEGGWAGSTVGQPICLDSNDDEKAPAAVAAKAMADGGGMKRERTAVVEGPSRDEMRRARLQRLGDPGTAPAAGAAAAAAAAPAASPAATAAASGAAAAAEVAAAEAAAAEVAAAEVAAAEVAAAEASAAEASAAEAAAAEAAAAEAAAAEAAAAEAAAAEVAAAEAAAAEAAAAANVFDDLFNSFLPTAFQQQH